LAWQLWCRTLGRRWIFQAGTYQLDPAAGMIPIANQIRLGQTLQTWVTIPEGWRIDQMAAALAERGWFTSEAFTQAAHQVKRPSTDWLPKKLPSLEGYLFPETYSIPIDQFAESVPPTQKAEAMVGIMLQQFATVALPLYRAHQQGKQPTALSLHEWVTLASIVEKEAVQPQERSLIAGVFTHRLKLGMPLGSDPTVEYALNIRQTPDRRLTWDEVKTPSPYNTYINAGLPPGPIASPGLASLQATLEPEQTDYLYFVAKYDGSHVFSKTLAEHEAAQLRIIRERQKQNSAPSP
jgi:UPF0755 protein